MLSLLNLKRNGYHSFGGVLCGAYATDIFSFSDENNVDYWNEVRTPDVFLLYCPLDDNSVVGRYILENYTSDDQFVWRRY